MTALLSVAWIVYLLVAGTLLVLAAGAVASALSIAGRSTRLVWAATLAGILALGFAAPRVPQAGVVHAASAMQAPSTSVVDVPRQRDLGALVRAIRVPVESALVGAIATVSGRVPGTVARMVVIGWSLASGLLLLIYLVVNLRISRARRHWPRERIHGVEVRVAPTAGPAVIGVLRAEIVVPRSLLERSAEEQRLIIVHEHEHLRARDNVLLGLACATVIVLPWHPAVWYVLARLRLAIELDCDARVLRRGAAPRSYGALLIDMAAHGAGIRVGTLALADRPSHLERRLLAMQNSRSRFALVRGGALGAVAGLLVLAACEAKIPTAAEITSMDVASAEKAASSSGAFGELANADFFLDGLKTTREQVLAIDSKRIGSIEIVKGGRDTVFVTSKERMKQADSTVVGTRIGRPIAGSGAQPAFMIDGVLVGPAEFAALRPEYIRSVDVRKPEGSAAERRYPNGLVVVTTGKTPIAPKERFPSGAVIRRKDSVPVSSTGGLADMSLSRKPVAAARITQGEIRSMVLTPGGDAERVYPITRVEMPTPAGAARGAGASADSSLLIRPLKDYAITIDGVRATEADLAALPIGEKVSVTMHVKDATSISSDPRAGNGLLEVTTRRGARKQ